MSAADNVQVGVVEQRGIDLVPDAERHGRPRDLFFMWLGTNTNVFYIVNGALLISLGLNFMQSLAVILLGNIFGFLLVGLSSIQGPRTGTSTFAINRASFGPHGGRVLGFFNWITLVGFEGSGLALAVICVLTLMGTLGSPLGGASWFKILAIIVVAGMQIYIPTLGHATIMAVQKVLAWVFVLFFLLVAVFVAGDTQFTGTHAGTLGAMTLGFALMVSGGGLSWANTGSDYSRYLPKTSRPGSIISAASLGGMIPAICLEVLGAAVAAHIPGASNPISGLHSALPGWFLAPYLVVLLFNLLSVNAIDLYSSGLTLQIVGFSIKRWQATLVDMVICTVLAAVAIFDANFNALYGNFLSLLIIFLAPWSAIYLTDTWMRRNTYDSAGLLAKSVGPYWYKGGVNPSGALAMVGGMIAASLWLNSSMLQGPLAHLFGGSDMSIFAGFIVGGVLYWIFTRAGLSGADVAKEASPSGVS